MILKSNQLSSAFHQTLRALADADVDVVKTKWEKLRKAFYYQARDLFGIIWNNHEQNPMWCDVMWCEKSRNKLIEFFVLWLYRIAQWLIIMDSISWFNFRWYLLRFIKSMFVVLTSTLKAVYEVISIISISLSIKLTICLDRL